jgi:hypothetical protein
MKRLALAAATTLAACSPTPTAPAPPPTTTTAPTEPTTAPTTAPPPQVAPPSAPRSAAAPAGVGGTVPATEGMPGQDETLAAIARCEGYPDHVNSDHPGESSASGKYGVLDSTWDGYGGYESAADAPEDVQDAWAAEAYARAGTRPWRASRSCWAGAA